MKLLLPGLLVGLLLTGCRQKAAWEKRFEEELAIQTTEEARTWVEFRYRRAQAEHARQGTFDSSDGVDKFEAWILADEYRQCVYGICGRTMVPESQQGRWVVLVAVGDPPPKMQSPIYIDMNTGRVEHSGYKAIEHTAQWLKQPEKPAPLPVPST